MFPWSLLFLGTRLQAELLVTLKWLTLVGSSKLGSGGAPNAGRIDTIVSTIAITGMKMASKSASKSYLVNLNRE